MPTNRRIESLPYATSENIETDDVVWIRSNNVGAEDWTRAVITRIDEDEILVDYEDRDEWFCSFEEFAGEIRIRSDVGEGEFMRIEITGRAPREPKIAEFYPINK